MSNYFNKKAEGTQVTGEKVFVSGLAEVQLKHDLLFDVQLFYDAELSNAVPLALFSLTDGYTDGDGATYYNAIALDSSLYSSYDFLYATYKSKADIVEAEDVNNKLDHIYKYECGETLSAYKAVELKNGKIWHVNLLVESEVDKTLGITLEDGVENQEIQVLLNGEYTNQEWSWDVDLPIYVNANGVLSQVEPVEGFTYIIAIPTSPISIKMAHKKKVVTDTEKTNWNSAYSKEHTHDNKTALDNVSGLNTGDQDLSNYPTLVNDAKGNFLVKGGKNYPISNVELDDLTSDYKAAGNTKPYLSFENPSEDQMVDLNIVPVTWVNELGVYGNFERDSNSDGLADGWSPTGINNQVLSTDRLYGNFSQFFNSNGTCFFPRLDNNTFFNSFDSGDVIFLSANGKTSNNFRITGNSGRFFSNSVVSDGEWVNISLLHTVGNLTYKFIQIGVALADGGAVPITGYAYIDGLQIFNLTKMGTMPTELQTYFGKTNFADLTASEVEEIAPDYVDSVQTVGYKFGDDSAEVVVNKGRNLWDKTEIRRVVSSVVVTETYIDSGSSTAYVFIPCKQNTTYTMSQPNYYENNGLRFGAAKYIPNDLYGSDLTWRTSYTTNYIGNYELTYTTESEAKYLILGVKGYLDLTSEIQIEEGSTATEYQPPKKYEETLPELWSMFGVSDEPDSKKFKRVKLVDAVQADGSIDWSWHNGAPSECLVINKQEDSANYGENAKVRMYSTESLGWTENDDVEVVYPGGYLEFSGGTNNATLTNFQLSGVVSYIVDIKCGLQPTHGRILGDDETGSIYIYSSSGNDVNRRNKISFVGSNYGVDDTFTVSNPITDNSWHRVEVKMDITNGTLKLYIDDIFIEEKTGITFDMDTDNPWRIGNNLINTRWFVGDIAYAAIVQDDVLLAEYKFNETGTTLKDYAGSNDGTIYGATWHDTEFDNTVETYSADTLIDTEDLFVNSEPKLMIEHGANSLFSDYPLFLEFETTYNQYELENIIRDRNNKLLEVEEREDGLLTGSTRTGKSFLINPTILTESTVGVMWDKTADTELTRTGIATNVTNFDLIYPFNQRRRVALDNTGVVVGVHLATDTNYWENGNAVDWAAYEAAGWNCMVQVPKFWYRTTHFEQHHWEIAPYAKPGFYIHPAFVKSDGTVMPYYYISAFEGWKDADNKLRSLPGKQPTAELTRPDVETYAANNGTGYKNMDFNTLWAEQLLWVVEMAELNSQSIYRGIVDLDSGTGNHSQNTGHTCSLGNASGEVEITPENGVTGATTVKPFSFRGHENFYGNIWKWISGWDKPDNGTNAIMGVDYTVETDTTSGYSTDFETTTPGFVTCKTTGGSESTYLCDYLYRTTSTSRAALFGGFWGNWGTAGAFFLNIRYPASLVDRSIGGRAAFL